MITVTSKSGKTVELKIEGASVVAKVGGMQFAVTRDGGKIESRFLVREAGSRRVEIALAGDDLSRANALFDELAAQVDRMAAEHRDYDSHHAKILRKMEGN